MKWYNAQVDGSPNHKDEVLVSVNGVYLVAVYDSKTKAYISKRDKKKFQTPGSNIYWAKIEPPNN